MVWVLLLSILLTNVRNVFKYATYDALFRSMLGLCRENSKQHVRTFPIDSMLRTYNVILHRLDAELVHQN